MKKIIVKTICAILMLAFTGLSSVFAQVNAPSIKSGVTFQWAAAQPNASSPAVLQSITIDGNVFDQFVIPSGYEMTQVGHNGHNQNRIQQNGVQVFSNSSNPGWNAAALAAFQDVNLNHYFESNTNGRNICNDFGAVAATDAQKQSLLYASGIPSNNGGFVAITERNANNCYHIAVYGEPNGGGPVQLLGQTFVVEGPTVFGPTFAPPAGASDYWLSGRVNENNGTIGIAIFKLSDLAPVGSTITRVQLTGATNDHGDGKFFIMQSYAVNESEVTPIDTVLNADAGENDNVPPGSTYTTVSGPSNGNLNLNADGTYTYTPNVGFTGPDSFVYQVCLPAPNNAVCDQATVNILVVTEPVAVDDSGSGLPGQPVTVDVLANDVPGTGVLIPSTVRIDGTANAGDPLTVPGQGQWTVNPVNGAITFTPQVGFNGNPTPIQYSVTDQYGLTTNLATVTVTYLVGPTANNDAASTPMNQPVTLNALANDTAGDAPLNPATLTFVPGTAPNPATVGTFTTDGSGNVTFTPVPLYTGPATVDYQICDTNGLCDTATITVTVTPVNGPTANNDSATTLMNTSVDVDVLANDSAGDAPLAPATLSLNPATAPNPATVGTFTINPNNTVKFTPVSQFQGVATIEYEICDTNGLCDTALITVAVASDGPVAVNDSATTFMNTPVNIEVLANDIPGDAALDPTSVTFVPGTLPNAATEGTFTVNNAGMVTFTPVNGYLGSVTVDYQVCQVVTAVTSGANRGLRGGSGIQSGLCDTATITVDVIPLPNPTANDDFATTEANEPVTVNVLANDLPGGAPLDPSTVVIVPGTEPNPATEGTFTVNPVNGAITFTPVNGFLGTVVSTYEVCNTAGFCDTALITIDVQVPAGPISNFFPAMGFGTLAFEDLWPGKGDYDFNDLVIDYQFEIVSNMNNFIEQVTGTFVIQAFGAAYQNGFGFQLPSAINAADLTVTGSSITEGYITLSANGTEAGQNAPTIIVFDNAYNEMAHPGGGAVGVNTEMSASYVTPKTITITIDFPSGIYTWNQLNIANFNPFLIVNMERGREIHLPGYMPTALANPAFFGTIEDATDLAQGRTYVTENNLPWAIHIYEKFDYPIEKQDIIWVHLKFVEWAESGGQTFQNWYQNLPGFRNQALIYKKP